MRPAGVNRSELIGVGNDSAFVQQHSNRLARMCVNGQYVSTAGGIVT